MRRLILVVATACSPAPDAPPVTTTLPPRQHVIDITQLTPLTLTSGSIPTNAIPAVITSPAAPGITRTGGLPARVYPAQPGIAPPFSALAIGPVDLEGALASKVVVDGVPLDASCRLHDLDTRAATLLGVDLSGRDLDEVVQQPFTVAGPVWVAGLRASKLRCDCNGKLDVEVSACAAVDAPYDIAAQIDGIGGATVSHIHVLLANEIGGAPSPYCTPPVACGAECTAAGGSCANSRCVLADSNRDNVPGYIAVDDTAVATVDENLRVAAASAFKVAFDARVGATLACPDGREFDFAGEIGVAGLFAGTRWGDANDAIVVEQQRWFSATFMALANVWNRRVLVSLRHPDRGPRRYGSGAEWPIDLRPLARYADVDGDGTEDDLTVAFPESEGTYYGNLFAGDCASSTHPDCRFGAGSGFANLVDYIRTADPPHQSLASDTNNGDECAAKFSELARSYDPAKNFIPAAINADVHWCVLEPRTCASNPVIASYFCVFDTSGYMTDYCEAAPDPAMGFTKCEGAGGRIADPWPEQVTAFLGADPETRFDVDARTSCRARNRLRIAVGGCDDPRIVDCDGNPGTADGCIGR